MSEPYSITDVQELREMVGVVPQPFAASPSSKSEIVDDDSVTPVKLSYQKGFTAAFSAPLPAGKVITRGMMNALGNLGSQCQFFEQCGGFWTFDRKVSDSIHGYPEGAFLQYFDEEKNELRTVRSLKDNNENDFVADRSFIDGDPEKGGWTYVDDNPPVGIEVDYSDYEDLSDTLFVGTGIPDLYEVPYDSYLQLFAIGTLDCASLRRDEAEDCQVYFGEGEDRVYRKLNGMYFTTGTGTSFLDVYSRESQTFGSVVLGGWAPYEWIVWNSENESEFHAEKICPISPFTCGIMLTKGDKIRIRNSLKDSPLGVVDPSDTGYKSSWPKGVVHERMFDDSVLRRNYLVRFANLYRRGVRV